MPTIAEIYKARMAKMNQFVTPEFQEELAMAEYGNDIYSQLKVKLEVITGKKVYPNYTFRSGKIMGLLACAAFAPKKEIEICELLHVTPTILDMFRKSCGRLPYLDSNNQPVEGIQQNSEMLRNIISFSANAMGLLLQEEDLNDISQERWEHLWALALEKQQKNEEFNSSTTAEVYKED